MEKHRFSQGARRWCDVCFFDRYNPIHNVAPDEVCLPSTDIAKDADFSLDRDQRKKANAKQEKIPEYLQDLRSRSEWQFKHDKKDLVCTFASEIVDLFKSKDAAEARVRELEVEIKMKDEDYTDIKHQLAETFTESKQLEQRLKERDAERAEILQRISIREVSEDGVRSYDIPAEPQGLEADTLPEAIEKLSNLQDNYAIAQVRAEGRKAGLEEAARANCKGCQTNYENVIVCEDGILRHIFSEVDGIKSGWACESAFIRALANSEAEKKG